MFFFSSRRRDTKSGGDWSSGGGSSHLVSFTFLFFSSIETGKGFLFLRSIFFGNSDLEKEKKKKNRSEESSTGKNRSKTGLETSIVIKKLATSLFRLILR